LLEKHLEISKQVALTDWCSDTGLEDQSVFHPFLASRYSFSLLALVMSSQNINRDRS